MRARLPKFNDLRFGTGLGVRYYSSFGPIRVDVGTPINRQKGESARRRLRLAGPGLLMDEAETLPPHPPLRRRWHAYPARDRAGAGGLRRRSCSAACGASIPAPAIG
jgi:hypothetical protein